MPTLSSEKIERLYLPSTKKAEKEEDRGYVDIVSNPKAGDFVDSMNDAEDSQRMFALIAGLVKAWNFTNEDGSPLEITAANVRRLETADYRFLSSYVNGKIVLDETDPKDNANSETSSST